MGSKDGGRLRLQKLCPICLSGLFLGGLALRVVGEFYGLPGFSIKGIEHPAPLSMLVIVGATYVFMAGTWGRFRPAVSLFMRVLGLMLMLVHDLSMLWHWGSHAASPWFSDAAEFLLVYTLPSFWIVQGMAASAPALSLLQLVMDLRWGRWRGPHGTGRPTPV